MVKDAFSVMVYQERLKIIKALAYKPSATAKEIAETVKLNQQSVSAHLLSLCNVGLVDRKAKPVSKYGKVFWVYSLKTEEVIKLLKEKIRQLESLLDDLERLVAVATYY